MFHLKIHSRSQSYQTLLICIFQLSLLSLSVCYMKKKFTMKWAWRKTEKDAIGLAPVEWVKVETG